MLSGKKEVTKKVSGKDNNKGKFRGLFSSSTAKVKKNPTSTVIRKSEKTLGFPRIVLEQDISHSR